MTDTDHVDAICDAPSIWARGFFAAQRAGADPVIAALRSFLGVINHTKCTRAIFCWEGLAKTNKPRVEKPEGYDDKRKVFEETANWLWGCPQVVSEQHEADDLVAALVYSELAAEEVVVVSGDKDLQQLIDCRPYRRTAYYCLNKKCLLDQNTVLEKWHVKRPSHIAIALAILGDRGDGITGIKGWGPAKVARLFEAVTADMSFEEAVLTIDNQVPGPLKQTFYDCLETTLLHQDAVITCGPEPLTWRHPDELDAAGLGELRSQYSDGYYATMPMTDDLG